MNVVLVLAHPGESSLTRSVADAAERGLRRAGHEVTVLDLYHENFVAAMSPDERAAYQSPAPLLDQQTRDYAAIASAAEMLVFVYPTWWSGLPAILQGWFERVLVPGVAFTLDEQTRRVRPGLSKLRRIVGISTYGSPWVWVKLLNDSGRRVITRALRMSAGWRTPTTWLALYHVDQADEAVRTAFLHRVEDTLARLR